MPVFNYSHSGFWEMAKIFTSDGKHVTNSLIQFLIHSQYKYLYFLWLKTGVTSEINLLRRCHCKTHRINFFHLTSFF